MLREPKRFGATATARITCLILLVSLAVGELLRAAAPAAAKVFADNATIRMDLGPLQPVLRPTGLAAVALLAVFERHAWSGRLRPAAHRTEDDRLAARAASD